jgi:hypothetical protein
VAEKIENEQSKLFDTRETPNHFGLSHCLLVVLFVVVGAAMAEFAVAVAAESKTAATVPLLAPHDLDYSVPHFHKMNSSGRSNGPLDCLAPQHSLAQWPGLLQLWKPSVPAKSSGSCLTAVVLSAVLAVTATCNASSSVVDLEAITDGRTELLTPLLNADSPIFL